MNVPKLVRNVIENLSYDLLRGEYKIGLLLHAPTADRKLYGHCYVACEALYHLGLRDEGWRPTVVRHEGGTHWFLRNAAGEVVDPTGGQFTTPVPYEDGRGCGFLTAGPSKRARELMSRVVFEGSDG